MHDLRAVVVQARVHGALVRSGARRKRPRGDVVLEQLVVDDVDQRGDQLLDVSGTALESLDVVFRRLFSERKKVRGLSEKVCLLFGGKAAG